MRNRYTYCPSAHEALLECKPAAAVAGLAVSVADLVERECAGIISGVAMITSKSNQFSFSILVIKSMSPT